VSEGDPLPPSVVGSLVGYDGIGVVVAIHVNQASLRPRLSSTPSFSAAHSGILFGAAVWGHRGDRAGARAGVSAGTVLLLLDTLRPDGSDSTGELRAWCKRMHGLVLKRFAVFDQAKHACTAV